jgi:hypothetical protein
MSEITNLTATREALRNLSDIVRLTRQTLAERLQHVEQFDWLGDNSQSGDFTRALEHVADIREGFVLSQRISPQITLSELRTLVQHILMDWQWIDTLNISLMPNPQIETLGQQLVAYNHALVALSVLPSLPATAVTFPQPKPTYSDVGVPTLPGETLTRIEEIEQVIYHAEIKPIRSLDHARFRRTYAFFEASGWLIDNYLAKLLQ